MSRDPDLGTYAKGPQLVQPPALQAELMALTIGGIEDRRARLKRKVLNDLIFVKGGTFMMGDFGPSWSPEQLYFSSGVDNKPAHKVTLTSYSLSRYKTTYAEFDVFTDATGRPRAAATWWNGVNRHPVVPAGLYWQHAKDYCTWLARETGVPFDLSTEAQWEYAARSGGQNFIWATDNGHLDVGRNAPSYEQTRLLGPVTRVNPSVQRTSLHPVGMFPPNPLGFYDMSSNGWEWMQDWYDASYYQVSPERDPKGPASGTLRVERGYAEGDYPSGGVLNRFSRDPLTTRRDIGTGIIGPGVAATHTVRCAVNLARPIAGVK
ncbi:formylglycine-generating enzyme family protein [Pandoraea terrae]|nr:SUMF1/EgtB/PvdO family nonheme iron enzyme [Pandoraea terrae]